MLRLMSVCLNPVQTILLQQIHNATLYGFSRKYYTLQTNTEQNIIGNKHVIDF